MQLILTTILIASLVCHNSFSVRIFETADEIFQSVLGDVYETKKRINKTDPKILMALDTAIARRISGNFTPPAFKSTTPSGPVATTVKHFNPTPEITTEYKRRIKRKLLIEDILRTNHTMPDLSKDMGDPSVLTKAFDAIKKPTRRQVNQQSYHVMGPQMMIYQNKVRVVSMMAHWVYATRYKLVPAQILRRRYISTFQFRIGYCYGLLRELKRKQKSINNAWQLHDRDFMDTMTYMTFYEKIVRLDVDIRDVLELIKSLVRGWKLQIDPEYFDHPLKDF